MASRGPRGRVEASSAFALLDLDHVHLLKNLLQQAEGCKHFGLISPMLVSGMKQRTVNGKYQLIGKEGRLMAVFDRDRSFQADSKW